MRGSKVKLGVIRWDAWVGDLNNVGLEVERTLSPKKYHNRLPFYAKLSTDGIKIRCDNKEIVSQEIEYASKYGIDYFAFCWYPFKTGLDTARNLFLEIEQTKIKWCLIIGTNPFSENDAKWLINQFSNDNYLNVDGRPVVYIFNINEKLLKIVEYIRENCGDVKPYFVGMVWNERQANLMTLKFKIDALTQYCTPGENGISYKDLSEMEIKRWNIYNSINKVIPWITTGFDKRPRFEAPVSWEKCDNFDTCYMELPKLDELKMTLDKAYQFQKENNGELLLIYAWNEFDEGGYVAPLLDKQGLINTDKLEVIKEIVDKYNN